MSDKKLTDTKISKCGYVAIVGRPNVGKSTLLNRILGQKLSITSRKPQTTRHQVLGISTHDNVQTIYVDTPGMHKNSKKAINRYMNRAARLALQDVDVVVFLVDAKKWQDDDEMVMELLKSSSTPVMLAINKIDNLKQKDELLPYIQKLSEKMTFQDVVPLCALHGDGVSVLEHAIERFLPVKDAFFSEDQITDRSIRFLAAEIIREKIIRQLGDEIPHETTVEIEDFSMDETLAEISACILVERSGQKAIMIGKKGQRLKQIGQQARLDIERLIDNKVMLNLWVKVKSGWSDDDRALQSLGYKDA